jgi:hypothetical protein
MEIQRRILIGALLVVGFSLLMGVIGKLTSNNSDSQLMEGLYNLITQIAQEQQDQDWENEMRDIDQSVRNVSTDLKLIHQGGGDLASDTTRAGFRHDAQTCADSFLASPGDPHHTPPIVWMRPYNQSLTFKPKHPPQPAFGDAYSSICWY